MKIKKSFLIICIIICLFSIASVCASEINNTQNTNVDNSPIGSTQNEDNSIELIEDNALNLEKTNEVSSKNPKSFMELNYTINNNDNQEVYLSDNYQFVNSISDSNFKNGIIINRNLTINGENSIIDGNNLAKIFKVNKNLKVSFKDIIFANGNSTTGGGAISGNCEIINCTFINNFAPSGGAICEVGKVINCTFINNYADKKGGAIYRGKAINCKFINNFAREYGGAIYFDSYNSEPHTNLIYPNNIFINCASNKGGAIYVDTLQHSIISNSKFEKCTSLNGGGAIYAYHMAHNDCDLELVSCEFLSCNTTNGSAGAIYQDGVGKYTKCNFINCFATSNGGALYCTKIATIFNCNFINCFVIENGGAIYGERYSYNTEVSNCIFNNCSAKWGGACYMCGIETIFQKSDFLNNYAMQTAGIKFDQLANNCKVLNCNFKNNNAQHKHYIENLNYINCSEFIDAYSVSGDKNEYQVISCSFNKKDTTIISNDKSISYNEPQYILITLKDSQGNILERIEMSINLNGVKKVTTDKNGQVKISTKGLTPKTYTATITFAGNINYEKSTKSIKITVKKATPKITAKKKTFKKKVKIKKYSVTLKDNNNKPIKNAKLTLKIKGKTHKSTTNKKGKATFKITKLNKKGTFKATITYKGNLYYNKIVKKNIKIIVKK